MYHGDPPGSIGALLRHARITRSSALDHHLEVPWCERLLHRVTQLGIRIREHDALLHLSGRTDAFEIPLLKASAAEKLRKVPGRTEYQRGILFREGDAWKRF